MSCQRQQQQQQQHQQQEGMLFPTTCNKNRHGTTEIDTGRPPPPPPPPPPPAAAAAACQLSVVPVKKKEVEDQLDLANDDKNEEEEVPNLVEHRYEKSQLEMAPWQEGQQRRRQRQYPHEVQPEEGSGANPCHPSGRNQEMENGGCLDFGDAAAAAAADSDADSMSVLGYHQRRRRRNRGIDAVDRHGSHAFHSTKNNVGGNGEGSTREDSDRDLIPFVCDDDDDDDDDGIDYGPMSEREGREEEPNPIETREGNSDGGLSQTSQDAPRQEMSPDMDYVLNVARVSGNSCSQSSSSSDSTTTTTTTMTTTSHYDHDNAATSRKRRESTVYMFPDKWRRMNSHHRLTSFSSD